jgi:hypothetical protein
MPPSNPAFGFQIWSGALSGGGAAVVLANLENASKPITLTNDEMPPSRQDALHGWDIFEAFSGTKLTGVALPQTVTVGAHDVAMWTLTPAAGL